MFCKNCGSPLDNNVAFCPNCGAGVSQTPDDNTSCTPPQAQEMNYSQQPTQPTNYAQPMNNTVSQELPMNWYKFLIYFALFAGALLNLINAIRCFTGSEYGDGKDLVYSFFGSLKVVDVLMGIVCLAVAALSVYTWFRLYQYRKDGPMFLMLIYIVNAVVTVLYTIVVMIIISKVISPGSLITAQTVISVLISIVMIFVNKVYFDKRKNLFVN